MTQPLSEEEHVSHLLADTYDKLPRNKTSLSFFYANARSIMAPGKFDELKCILKAIPTNIHFILLTESWIKSEEDALRLELLNYTHYYNYRTDARGGGVSIFVHNDLTHNLIEEQYIGGNNYLWIHINKHNLDVGLVYRPGDTNDKEFIETYGTQQRKRAIVFGDFNLDLLRTNPSIKSYKELLAETGFSVLNKIDIKYCTREKTSRKSIIDHVCTNIRNNKFYMAVTNSAMSDHKQLYLEVTKTRKIQKKRINYEAVDYKKLYETLKCERSAYLLNNYLEFDHWLTTSIKKSTTTKSKILNLPQEDWINKEIIDGINARNVTYQKFKQDETNEKLQKELHEERNKIANKIKTCKSKYYTDVFKKCTKQPKKMWNLINKISKNKINNSCTPPKLMDQSGVVLFDVNDICECFNEFFSSIGTILSHNIPQKYHNNISNSLPQDPNNKQELLKLKHCTNDEVSKIIDMLDTNVSKGLDGITAKMIKSTKPLILESLTNCINTCLDSGYFPDSLKIAKVTPIHKAGNKQDPNNYRPISVLPIVSKIYEKVIYTRLDNFLTSINFLYKYQYGFRPKCNTLSATIDLITKIKNNIDKRNIALGIMIDLKKAFDTVSHHLLLKKLQRIEISSTAYELFKSYLTNRQQIVKIGEH